MATLAYAYKGRDSSGKIVKGELEGASEIVIASRLRSMGLSPISITESSSGTGLSREITIPGFSKGVGLKDLAIMSRQLATMIASGLSLLRALTILSEQTPNKALQKLLVIVMRDVESGVALSDALYKHRVEFPPIMINLVRAGETGGFLDEALETIAANFESEVKLRSTIKSALTYPVVVLVMAVVAVVVMLIFIVPIFQKLFAGLGGQLPLPTQFLVWMSSVMTWAAPLLIVLGIAFSIWWRANRNTERVRKIVDPVKLRLPVFGKLFQKIAVARFTRNFSSMMGAGVPILQALSIVGETSGNWVVESALRDVADSVRQGKTVAEPLSKAPVFPAMVTQMITVGEDAGALEQMLGKIADFYDEEVQSTTEQLTAMIEPLMIAFLGIVVGGMIVCLYLPIFNIFTLIK
ncbi:type II secretion system F family protein [Galbitalea soli]|uniref:Type II secretion system F family protein n=1 Tax=Galbitalea soli TaxID=1268042 RepID=A0A7C9TQ53_9MICO|nr:type II secretion system F family protein [Galbitalea soli]NEM91197.1 type II secretion system F family protein [Galbitalea soli]NYJ29886.1 type IV pilus assembly protein PilC [Galbitalea soli]